MFGLGKKTPERVECEKCGVLYLPRRHRGTCPHFTVAVDEKVCEPVTIIVELIDYIKGLKVDPFSEEILALLNEISRAREYHLLIHGTDALTKLGHVPKYLEKINGQKE